MPWARWRTIVITGTTITIIGITIIATMVTTIIAGTATAMAATASITASGNTMKLLAILVMALTLIGIQAPAAAEQALQSSRSAGKLKSDLSVDLSARLERQDPLLRAKPATGEDYLSSGLAQRNAGVANRHDQLFEIYQADIELLADLDDDGYYHSFNVVFDVDVDYDEATVYAKIFVSREGEPWSQVFTTDLFQIYGDEVADTYEVETELLDGYAPGYYSVLIEIYSLDHAYMVASELLDHHYLGWDILFEDFYWDEPPVAAQSGLSVKYHSHGGGSMAALVLFFLSVQVVIAARGAIASNPPVKKRKLEEERLPWLAVLPPAR